MSNIIDSFKTLITHPNTEQENQDRAHLANMRGLITSLIKSIAYASSREELAYLVRITRDYIHDYAPGDKNLTAALKVSADKEELKISEESHVTFDKKNSISNKNDDELYNCFRGSKEVNLVSLSVKETIDSEQKKEKTIEEEKSKFRPEAILALGKEFSKTDKSSESTSIKKASLFKVKMYIDKSGRLVPEDKSLRDGDDVSRHCLEELEIQRILQEPSSIQSSEIQTIDKEFAGNKHLENKAIHYARSLAEKMQHNFHVTTNDKLTPPSESINHEFQEKKKIRDKQEIEKNPWVRSIESEAHDPHRHNK